MLLKDTIAIITGASCGLGREIALRFSAEGASLALVARTASKVGELAHEINCNGGTALAVPADITNGQSVRYMVDTTIKHFGRIDALVNNAGTHYTSSALLSNPEHWKSVIDTNLFGTFLCCRYVLKHMLLQRRGKIVNMASTSAKMGVAFCTAYSASKAGVVGLTRSLAVEVAKENISVNAVCPGPVEGFLSEHARGEWARIFGLKPEDFQQRIREGIPKKKFINVENVISLVVMLASDNFRDITGQAINVDGGSLPY